MTDTITITGLVATTPRFVTTQQGLDICSFRLASTQRRFDRNEQKWVDGDTNWYTVTAFRGLAKNVLESIQKGQRVLVAGKLRIRDWATDEKSGTTVEIDVDNIGHDLTFGTSVFTRNLSPAEQAAADTQLPFADTTSDAEAPTDENPQGEKAEGFALAAAE